MKGTIGYHSQTDAPFRRIIPGNSSMNTNYPDSSSRRMDDPSVYPYLYAAELSDELSSQTDDPSLV